MHTSPFMQRSLLILSSYLFLSCIVHYLLFPETMPNAKDYPRQGDTVLNEAAGERVTFTKDRFTGNADEVIIEVDLAAHGSIPMAHIHSKMDEVFSAIESTTQLTVDGETHSLAPGNSIHIPAGVPHLPHNTSATPSKIQVTMTPIGVFDLCLVNIHRTLGATAAGQSWISTQLQMARYAQFCDVYRGDVPVWLQQAGLFLLAPTIRLLGYHPWQETTS